MYLLRHLESAQFSNNSGNDLAKLYSKQPGLVPMDDFTHDDRERVLELLLSQERVVSLLYAKTFPVNLSGASGAGGGGGGGGMSGYNGAVPGRPPQMGLPLTPLDGSAGSGGVHRMMYNGSDPSGAANAGGLGSGGGDHDISM